MVLCRHGHRPHCAAAVGGVMRVGTMAAEGADVSLKGGPQGARPLHTAAANGHVDAVRVRREVGAEVEGFAGAGIRTPAL